MSLPGSQTGTMFPPGAARAPKLPWGLGTSHCPDKNECMERDPCNPFPMFTFFKADCGTDTDELELQLQLELEPNPARPLLQVLALPSPNASQSTTEPCYSPFTTGLLLVSVPLSQPLLPTRPAEVQRTSEAPYSVALQYFITMNVNYINI